MDTLVIEHPATTEVKKTRRSATGGNAGQGMNWLTQNLRLALYLRDGLACVYCGSGVEEGIKLTLDHLIPRSKGGALRDPKNLVTACATCNSKRGDRSVGEFAKGVAAYNGTDVVELLKRIKNTTRRKVDLPRAKEMIALRGSCAKVIQMDISKAAS